VPEGLARIERGAQLPDVPALDQAYFVLGHVAARELLEQLERRGRGAQLVVAGLDALIAPERAREDLEPDRLDRDARLPHERHRCAKARAGRQVEGRRQGGHRNRRDDVPRGIARRGERA